jgi:cystathionine beta-lyase/cystathionine gamma-synthase
MPSAYTRLVHGGSGPDPATGAILTPIHQVTTYVQEAVGVHKGFTYTRSGNPTVRSLEEVLGAAEGTSERAVAFSTGMAATTALFLSELSAGDHVVCGAVVYGGTVRLLRQVLEKFDVRATFVDATDARNVEAAIETRTKIVFVETPANPTLVLTDIAAVAKIARGRTRLVVDNTFLTPALQRPLELGADAVLYSTTKFLEGHNTTVGGAILSNDASFLERLRFVQNAVGFAQSPFEAWLTVRGLKTLPLRMKRHADNALRVADHLERHPRVRAVHYPGLASFPQAELARRQQESGGGVLAFEVEGGVEAGIAVLNAVELCALAENLGSVETLITHPASMTHADIPREDRLRAGISDGLIRLSVGLEDPEDVIADLDRALEASC